MCVAGRGECRLRAQSPHTSWPAAGKGGRMEGREVCVLGRGGGVGRGREDACSRRSWCLPRATHAMPGPLASALERLKEGVPGGPCSPQRTCQGRAPRHLHRHAALDEPRRRGLLARPQVAAAQLGGAIKGHALLDLQPPGTQTWHAAWRIGGRVSRSGGHAATKLQRDMPTAAWARGQVRTLKKGTMVMNSMSKLLAPWRSSMASIRRAVTWPHQASGTRARRGGGGIG